MAWTGQTWIASALRSFRVRFASVGSDGEFGGHAANRLYLALCACLLLDIGLTIGNAQAQTPTRVELPDGGIANSAILASESIIEIGQDQPEHLFGIAESMMNLRREHFLSHETLPNDPYPAWLSSKFSMLAAKRQLFVFDQESGSMRIADDIGDPKFLYLCRLTSSNCNDEVEVHLGPSYLWMSAFSLSDPPVPPFEDFRLQNVSHGQIVQLEVYRFPRRTLTRREVKIRGIPSGKAFESEGCRLLFQIQLPVLDTNAK